jgi:hypothetical protein
VSKESPVLRTREQLLEEYEAAKLRLAFYDLQEEQNEEYEKLAENNTEISNLASANQASDFHLIRQTTRQLKTKNFMQSSFKMVRRAAQVASILIVIFVLGTSTAFAVSPNFQVTIRNLLIRMTDEYTEIGLQNTDTISVPEGWEGHYYPSYIPDGFSLVQQSDFITDSGFVEYEDASRNRLSFAECAENARTNIDTENAKITYTTVHDNEAMVVEKNGRIKIVWAEFDRYFIVMFDGDTNTALSVARSVRRIK